MIVAQLIAAALGLALLARLGWEAGGTIANKVRAWHHQHVQRFKCTRCPGSRIIHGHKRALAHVTTHHSAELEAERTVAAEQVRMMFRQGGGFMIRLPIVRRDEDGSIVDGTARYLASDDGVSIDDFRDLNGNPLSLPPGSTYLVTTDQGVLS